MTDSPSPSSLSSLSSENFTEELKVEDHDMSLDDLHDAPSMPPAKRQRMGTSYDRRSSNSHAIEYDNNENDTESDISSDTSGDVPGSPTSIPQMLEDDGGHEQVTACRWEGCPVGDLDNMDRLVTHIHDVHIGARQKKYACEWDGCTRKGMPHASGYALRAHMRSHTREKPFFCALPECDRSFTRSDALAKHMRTVHETEALRPSDPVPKNHSSNPPNRNQRLKLIISARPPDEQHNGDDEGPDFNEESMLDTADAPESPNASELNPSMDQDDLKFTEEERQKGYQQLFRLLRRDVAWAEEETLELEEEVDSWKKRHKEEWLEKELALSSFMEAEVYYHARKHGTVPDARKIELLPERELALTGETPWYRRTEEETS